MPNAVRRATRMASGPCCGLALALCIMGSGLWTILHAAQDQQVLFRTPVDVVPLFVTVTDAANHVVANLSPADFIVRDNGQVRPIAVFDASPRPLNLVVMLDTSGSMASSLDLLREAAVQLIDRVRPDDQVRVGSFGSVVAIGSTPTSDRDALRRMLPASINPRALTPLWRAIDDAMNVLEGSEVRPVIVVLSDGRDTGPDPGERVVEMDDVMRHATETGVMIYAIGLHSRGGGLGSTTGVAATRRPGDTRDDRPDPGLRLVSERSGGRYFEVDVDPQRDLGAAFATAMDELRSQYLLGISPARDGAVHEVAVTVNRPGLSARARRSYLAPAR